MQIRAMVVDDTALYRKLLSDVMGRYPEAAVVATAESGMKALDLLASKPVDLVLLDIHMPGMDGVETLRHIRAKFPNVMVVMVSGISTRSASTTIEALQMGAIDFVSKPSGADFRSNMDELASGVHPILRLVEIRLQARAIEQKSARSAPPQVSQCVPDGAAPPAVFSVVAIGVSTGGPEALGKLIPALPEDFPLPIVLVQHMPAGFTKSLADSLDAKSKLHVKEGEEDEDIRGGTVYLAPGGRHMTLRAVNGSVRIGLNDGPPENSCRPSVDVMFRSVAGCYSSKAVLAVVMTGMGNDGVNGVRALKRKNCYCLTQSHESCVIYGMPRAVDEAGLADRSLALDQIAAEIVRLVLKR